MVRSWTEWSPGAQMVIQYLTPEIPDRLHTMTLKMTETSQGWTIAAAIVSEKEFA